jgi:hypothetical protein
MAGKKKKVGRPKIKKSDKLLRIPITAKVKHHEAIKEEFASDIAQFEIKLESNGK